MRLHATSACLRHPCQKRDGVSISFMKSAFEERKVSRNSIHSEANGYTLIVNQNVQVDSVSNDLTPDPTQPCPW